MYGRTSGFFIHDSGVYTRFLRPETKDKCPLVVLFHGIPGTELNLDLAYELRENGFAVLAPNYNGCWGSKGDYRIEGIPGNIRTVLDFACSDEFVDRAGIDPERICVVGHSLGGWAALISPRISQRVRGIVAIDPLVDPMFGREAGDDDDDAAFLHDFAVPLRGVTAKQLAEGMRFIAREWLPIDVIADLGDRFFMLLCATGPDALPLDPSLALLNRVRSSNPAAEFWALNSDHSFISCRPLMRKLVVDFVRSKLA